MEAKVLWQQKYGSPMSMSGSYDPVAKVIIKGDHSNRNRDLPKIDPATGVVLGGSIVGRHAAELISVIAVAVTAHLTVTDLVESILVHPALSEALAEAAE